MHHIKDFGWASKDLAYIDIYESLEKEYGIFSAGARSIIAYAGIKKDDLVLDLGCGTGLLSREILAAVKPEKLCCLDVSPLMLEQARTRLGNLPTYVIADFSQDWNLRQRFGHILSSFTIYYLEQCADAVYSQVLDHLQTDGAYTFNVTSFLDLLHLGNLSANAHCPEIYDRLDTFLKNEGYEEGIGKNLTPTFRVSPSLIESKLLARGFKTVNSRFAELPLTPYRAFRFSLEGFYSQGMNPEFSSTLCQLPPGRRCHLLSRFLDGHKKYLDSLPNVQIVEMKAGK